MTTATSITVRVPLAIRHRPGRKTVVMPDSQVSSSTTTRSTSERTIRDCSAGKRCSHSGSRRCSASCVSPSVSPGASLRAARQVPTTISGWRSSART